MSSIAIDQKLAVQALSATWANLLNFGTSTVKANKDVLDTLAAEMIPQVTALTNDALGADVNKAAAALRALKQSEVIVQAELERLGLHDLASGSAELAAGLTTAVSWLGVLVKAAVL